MTSVMAAVGAGTREREQPPSPPSLTGPPPALVDDEGLPSWAELTGDVVDKEAVCRRTVGPDGGGRAAAVRRVVLGGFGVALVLFVPFVLPVLRKKGAPYNTPPPSPPRLPTLPRPPSTGPSTPLLATMH